MGALTIIEERGTGENNNNVWLAGVMSNGLIVGNSSSESVRATSLLSAAKTKDTVSKDLVDRLTGGPMVPSSESPDLYPRYVREFGTNPDNLSTIVRSMSIPPVDTLRYIRTVVSGASGQDYRLGFIEDDDLAEDLFFSNGLIEDRSKYLGADTHDVLLNNASAPGKICRHCGLGWVTHSNESKAQVLRILTSGLGIMQSHFVCGRQFSKLNEGLRRTVSQEMLVRAFTGLTHVFSEDRSIESVEDLVRIPASHLVSTPVKVQLYPGRPREDLILWHMQNAIARTILQGSQRHAISDAEIGLFRGFIAKYGFDRLGPRGQSALQRLVACTNLNKLARREKDAYIGPNRSQLPFNIPSSETLYWSWSNVTYELRRLVNRTVSRRERSGTTGGVNTSGSMTTEYESTTVRDNRVENLGTGYLGITDKAFYFSAATRDGQSVQVPFDRLVTFRPDTARRIEFQENARQGDRQWPRSFSGDDVWEIDMAFRTLTRPSELTTDQRRQAWRELTPPGRTMNLAESDGYSWSDAIGDFKAGYRKQRNKRSRNTGTDQVGRCPSCASMLTGRQNGKFICQTCGYTR